MNKNYFFLLSLIFLITCSQKKPSQINEFDTDQPVFWYRQPLRILQTVLRQPDAVSYNADSVVAYMNRIHANVLVINGGGVVDFFQNSLPMAHVNHFMENRDILREITTACHKNNIKVIARVDFRGVEKDRYEQHPDWFARNKNGGPIMLTYTTPELYAPCYNSYYRNEHAVKFISHLFENYQIDGIWHNAVNFYQVCYCDRCRKEYRTFSGKEIPVESNPESDWEEFYKWRAVDAREQLTLMRNTVKKYGEDKTYTAEVFNMFDVNQQKHTGIDLYSAAEFFDFLVTVSFIADNSRNVEYKDLSYAASIVKFLKSLNSQKSPVILFGGNGTEHRYIYDPPADLRQWLWEAAANGGGFWNCYFNGSYPAVTLDTRNAYLSTDAYKYLENNESLIRNLQPVRDVALYYSKSSAQILGDEEFSYPIRGMIRMLEEAHFQFGFISDYDLSAKDLGKLKVLILPNVVNISHEHANLIRDWVSNGGKLMATYETSLYDESGNRLEDFRLADLFGVHFTGEIANTDIDCYQKIITRNALSAGFQKTTLIHNGDRTLLCVPEENTVVVTGYLPKINNQPPENAFPDNWNSHDPIAVRNSYGKGEVIYFANQPGRLNLTVGHPDYHQLLSNAVNVLLGDRVSLTTNAPASVHVYLNQDRQHLNRFQLTLVNTTAGPDRPIRNLVPVRDIEIRVPGGVSNILKDLYGGSEVQIKDDRVRISQLDEFCSMILEIQNAAH